MGFSLAKMIFTIGLITVASILSLGLFYVASSRSNKNYLWLGTYLLLMAILFVTATNVADTCIAYLTKLLN